MQEIGNRGPRLGPWDKALRFFSLYPVVSLGWKLCCKQEACGDIHTYIYRAIKGARAGK